MVEPLRSGASVPDQALAVPVEPASGLAPSGFDPSRLEAKLGAFYVYGHHAKRNLSRSPRFKHDAYESAEREAHRLSAKFPEAKFLILRTVAVVTADNEEK